MPTNNSTNNTAPGYLLLSGGTMSGTLTLNGNPSASNDAANKAYVDAATAGLTAKNSCYCATTTALTVTYANGSAGIGATLTNAATQAAFSVDGQSPGTVQRVLVKNQASTFQNGIYTVTTVGSGASNWVLTRSTDYDETSEIHAGDLVPIEFGTTNTDTTWLQTATVAAIGTDPITFSQFSYGPTTFLQKANNLSDVASASTSFNNIAPATIKGGSIIGSGVNTYTNDAVGTDYQFRMADSSATNGQSWKSALSWGGVPLQNIKFPSGQLANAGSGDIDAYTCPTNRRAMILSVQAYNTAGTTTNWHPQVKISGTYYQLQVDSAIGTLGQATLSSSSINYILDPNEIFSIHTSQSGLNLILRIVEFDNTSNIKSSKLTTLASGNNTVYTCPANKTAMLLSGELIPLYATSATQACYMNNSGGSRNIIWYVVPSGQSVGSTYQFITTTAVGSNTRSNLTLMASLNTGDFIVINTNANTATQMAWVNVLEF